MSAASHITGVSHVSINVADMDRSVAFYREAFGWEQLFDEHMEGAAFDAITGVSGAAGRACGGRIRDIRVELMSFNFTPHAPPGAGLGLRVLSLEVDDADAAHQELVAAGIKVASAPVDLHGTRMFFVVDPDGQMVELVEYVRGGPAWGGAYSGSAPR
jgi:catechol 2,3-dioxygenase-like lactoylglutathione lyase family enzyme